MPLYICKHCDYSTNLKGNYDRHIKTNKHRLKILCIIPTSISEGVMSQNEPKMSQNEPKRASDLPKSENPIKSDDLTINDHISINIIESLSQQNHNSYKSHNSNNLYKCEFCDEVFSSQANKRRHELHRCKNNEATLIKKLNEKEQYIKQMERERKELYKKIDELISKVGNTYNQNIILNNYGSEDTSHITDQFKTQLLKIPYMMIPKMIEAVHFSDDKPENKNIALTNKKENKVKVFKNNKWVYQNKKEVISDLMDNKYYTLDSHYEKYKDTLDNHCQGNYSQFKEYMNEEDKEFVDKLQEECENVLLTNR